MFYGKKKKKRKDLQSAISMAIQRRQEIPPFSKTNSGINEKFLKALHEIWKNTLVKIFQKENISDKDRENIENAKGQILKELNKYYPSRTGRSFSKKLARTTVTSMIKDRRRKRKKAKKRRLRLTEKSTKKRKRPPKSNEGLALKKRKFENHPSDEKPTSWETIFKAKLRECDNDTNLHQLKTIWCLLANNDSHDEEKPQSYVNRIIELFKSLSDKEKSDFNIFVYENLVYHKDGIAAAIQCVIFTLINKSNPMGFNKLFFGAKFFNDNFSSYDDIRSSYQTTIYLLKNKPDLLDRFKKFLFEANLGSMIEKGGVIDEMRQHIKDPYGKSPDCQNINGLKCYLQIQSLYIKDPSFEKRNYISYYKEAFNVATKYGKSLLAVFENIGDPEDQDPDALMNWFALNQVILEICKKLDIKNKKIFDDLYECTNTVEAYATSYPHIFDAMTNVRNTLDKILPKEKIYSSGSFGAFFTTDSTRINRNSNNTYESYTPPNIHF